MRLIWNRHFNGKDWFFETPNGHVAGTVEKRNGQYIVGVAIPYEVDEEGNEKDWEENETPFVYLHEATAWVEENARWTVQGEYINFKEIGKLVHA